MAWIDLAILVTRKHWLYTIPISSPLIRISQVLSAPAPFYYGYFCQAQFILPGKVEKYRLQKLLIDLEDYTIFELDYSIPSLLGNQIRIGIQGQQQFEQTNIMWTVKLEQWQI